MHPLKQFIYFIVIMLISAGCKSKDKRHPQAPGTTIQNENITLNPIFIKGQNGYACFRIPAIVVTHDGSILAFSEARKNSCSDTGDIDLVMRKSTDNGASWGEIKVIWDDGENVCGNPAPVIDEKSGRIHLLSTWNLGEDHESEIIEGTSKGTREIVHLISNDDGNSWTAPKNITKSVKLPNWTWYATGPVHGIQLNNETFKGRLVIPCDFIASQTKKMFSHIIYSDDNGQTWQFGGIAPNDKVNESTVAELENGDLLLNMRNYNRDSIQGRQIAFSSDGGLTWKDQYIEENLPEPVCQGALLAVERNDKQVLLFSNPSNNESRTNMTVTLSRDQGKSWNEKISIYKEHAAYSDLAELKNGAIAIVFEAGIENAYEGIFIKTITLED